MRIPLNVPMMVGREAEYLADCVRTGWVSSAGPYVGRFEEELRAIISANACTAVGSGTAALQLALLAAGVRAGDAVVVPTISFIASANAVRHCGAEPLFVDVDAEHACLDPGLLEHFLQHECRDVDGKLETRDGRIVSAIMPVHVFGHIAAIDELRAVAERFSLPLIEDATEALGTTWRGEPIGSTGRFVVFSFNGNKILTTGAGGALVSEDPQVVAHARHLATQAKLPGIGFIHDEVGFNHRMSNLHAAVGVAQLEGIKGILERRRRTAELYKDLLPRTDGVEYVDARDGCMPNGWLNIVRLTAEGAPSASDVAQAMVGRGIECRPLWQPLHWNRPYRSSTVVDGARAARLFSECLCLPSSTDITLEQVREVCETLARTLAEAPSVNVGARKACP